MDVLDQATVPTGRTSLCRGNPTKYAEDTPQAGAGVGVGLLANINLNLAISSMFAKTYAVSQAGIGASRQIPQLERQALKCRLFLGTLKWDMEEVMNDVVVTTSKWALLSVWQGIVEMVRMLDCRHGWAAPFITAWSEITLSFTSHSQM